MDFIRYTSPKHIQVQFLVQKNAQKRVQNVQDETGRGNQECQSAVEKCQLAQIKNWTPACIVQVNTHQIQFFGDKT